MPRQEWSFFMLPEDHKQVKWLLSFLQAKYTVWGQIIFGMILVGLGISAVGTEISAYFSLSFIGALFITASALSFFSYPTLTVQRVLPPTPTAGGVCLYRVSVTNVGKKTLRNVEIFDHRLPYGLYAQTDHPQHNNCVDWLEPGQHIDLTMALRIPRRGTFVLEPMIIGSSFPSGLLRAIRRVGGRNSFVVYPKILRISQPETEPNRKSQPGGSVASAKFGISNEFLSTREYRPGDRPRDIHWNSSARAGKLIVKEYIDEDHIRIGLFLDTHLKRFEKHRCFETQISLCAGIAERCFHHNTTFELFLNDKNSSRLETGSRLGHFNYLLEMLSAVEGEDFVEFARPLSKIKQRVQQMSKIILFLRDWDPLRSEFVAAIQECRVLTEVIIVRDQPLTLAVSDPSVHVFRSLDLAEGR